MQKQWKQRIPKKLFEHFRLRLQKQNWFKKVWNDEGTNFALDFEKGCSAERVQIYPTES